MRRANKRVRNHRFKALRGSVPGYYQKSEWPCATNAPSASRASRPRNSEHELEQALLGNVRRFLVEMGGDFAFLSNQYRLELEGQDYFIDLLLFHRELQCLVALELKATEFRPEYAGKMNFYLSLLNAQVKKPHEQPSIGIIICQRKQRTVVEFALRDISKPIGVATYTLTDTLPAELRPFFPSNEELARRLDAVTATLRAG